MNSGKKYGYLTIVKLSHKDKYYRNFWQCKCDCGKESVVREDNLKRGTRSCGCLIKKTNTTHGFYKTPTYKSWSGMIQRCINPKNHNFPLYGGRGIKVCERWMKFKNFLADMGPAPNGYSIERINNNGNYGIGNCRWATPKEQSNNTRRNRLLEYKGQIKTISEWSNVVGIRPTIIATRLWRKWSIERALTERPQTK